MREALAAPLRRAGYGYVETPVFEDTALFSRGVGESTDIVTKEMYTFTKRGDEVAHAAPRGHRLGACAPSSQAQPAQAASCRSSSGTPARYYRYERPQKGRYRHFSQVGAEAIGAEDPALDAELIIAGRRRLPRARACARYRLLLNTLGDKQCRPVYRAALQEFLRGLDLDEETRAPRRDQPAAGARRQAARGAGAAGRRAAAAPTTCARTCKAYHERGPRAARPPPASPSTDDPRLVRGLDYYTRTTFEFVHDGLGAQSAIGGGGRYDGLSEMLGGPPLPSVGWALGVDRTVLALEAEGIVLAGAGAACDVFAVPLGEAGPRTCCSAWSPSCAATGVARRPRRSAARASRAP